MVPCSTTLDFSICWEQATSFEDFARRLQSGRHDALNVKDWRHVAAWLFEKTNAEKSGWRSQLSPSRPAASSEGLLSTPMKAKFGPESIEGQFINALSPPDSPQPSEGSPASTRSPMSNWNQTDSWMSPEKVNKPVYTQKPPNFDLHSACLSKGDPNCTDCTDRWLTEDYMTDAFLQDPSMELSDEQFERLQEAATKTFDYLSSAFSMNRDASQITMPDLDSGRRSMVDSFDDLHMTQPIPQDICRSARRRGSAKGIAGYLGSSCDQLRMANLHGLSLRPDASKSSSIKCHREAELTRKRSTPAALRHASPPAQVKYMPSATVTLDPPTIRTAPSVGRCAYPFRYVITPPPLRHSVSLHARMSPRGI